MKWLWPKFMRGRGNQPGEDDETYFVLFAFIAIAVLLAVLIAL